MRAPRPRIDRTGAALALPGEEPTLALREKQIAALIAQGKSNHQIAATLHLADGTIKDYLHRIFGKLGVYNRTGVAVWWIEKHRTEGA